MTQLERELAEHLRYLTLTIGPRPLGSVESLAAGRYVGATLNEWGFVVEALPSPRSGTGTHIPGVVGRLGMSMPTRVQLRARLDSEAAGDDEAGAAGLAVLLALGRLLSQHQLHHGLEVIAYSDAYSRAQAGVWAAPPPLIPSTLLATVSFEDPGQSLCLNQLSVCGVSAALSVGARRLLSRYPEVTWAELVDHSCGRDCVGCAWPRLRVGAGGVARALPRDEPAYSPRRLREAVMLGAELVALLQGHTAASCRP